MQIASDIHLEFEGAYEELPNIEVKSDFLCLLGDIGYPFSKIYKNFLHEQSERFKYVLVVAGNHEYYQPYKNEEHSIEEINIRIEEICNEKDNLYFLNKTRLELDDTNLIFLGCTLWSMIPQHVMIAAEMVCNDFNYIFFDDEEENNERKKLTVEKQNSLHKEHKDWLTSEIDDIKSNEDNEDKKIIVLCHHAPTLKNSLDECESSSNLRHVSGSELRSVYSRVDCICYGHTHHTNDQMLKNCRIVSNQLGYVGQHDPKYDVNYVIDPFKDSEELKYEIFLRFGVSNYYEDEYEEDYFDEDYNNDNNNN